MNAPRLVRFDRALIRDGVSLMPSALPFHAVHSFMLENWSGGERERGGHAHKAQTQALLVLASRVVVLAEQRNGDADKYLLRSDDPTWLVIYPGTWITLRMSQGARLLGIVDGHYDPADYLRERDAWKALA